MNQLILLRIEVSRITRERAEESSGHGKNYLNIHHPDWHHRVPEDFNISGENTCIVHYLTGKNYSEGVPDLKIAPIRLGFYVSGDQKDPAVVEEYHLLTMNFRTERAARLRKDAAQTADTCPETERELELTTV